MSLRTINKVCRGVDVHGCSGGWIRCWNGQLSGVQPGRKFGCLQPPSPITARPLDSLPISRAARTIPPAVLCDLVDRASNLPTAFHVLYSNWRSQGCVAIPRLCHVLPHTLIRLALLVFASGATRSLVHQVISKSI